MPGWRAGPLRPSHEGKEEGTLMGQQQRETETGGQLARVTEFRRRSDLVWVPIPVLSRC